MPCTTNEDGHSLADVLVAVGPRQIQVDVVSEAPVTATFDK